jgi:hypothetical protein
MDPDIGPYARIKRQNRDLLLKMRQEKSDVAAESSTSKENGVVVGDSTNACKKLD